MYTDPGTPEKVQSLNMAASESNRVSLVAQLTSLVAQTVKHLSIMLETQVQSLGWEDPLEKGMTTHSSILAPPPKKKGSKKYGEGNDNPLQYSCLEDSMDRGACWSTVHGVAKSQT